MIKRVLRGVWGRYERSAHNEARDRALAGLISCN